MEGKQRNSSKETASAKNAAEMTLKNYLQSHYIRSDSLRGHNRKKTNYK